MSKYNRKGNILMKQKDRAMAKVGQDREKVGVAWSRPPKTIPHSLMALGPAVGSVH